MTGGLARFFRGDPWWVRRAEQPGHLGGSMSTVARGPGSLFAAKDWPADVTQLLDEHHLTAWSAAPRLRVQFGATLGQFLAGLPYAELCVLHGRDITDLESFCTQLERVLPGPVLERQIDGPGGVVSLLRTRHRYRGRANAKYRYYLWHDADTLLKHDRALFARLADAFMGVAAESEYVSDDLLLVHRAIFVGGPLLDLHAEDESGPMRSWYQDGQGEPFWQVVTGVERPPTMRFHIDSLR